MKERELPTFNELNPLLQSLYLALLAEREVDNDTVISSAALKYMYYFSDKYELYTHKDELRKSYVKVTDTYCLGACLY